MQLYNVIFENENNEVYIFNCMCSSKYEASRAANIEISNDEKLKDKGFLVTDIKMIGVNDEIEYTNTNTIVDIIKGDKNV